MTRDSAVRIAVLLPELLGTYGDGGNATILTKRLEWRGFRVERIDCSAAASIPVEVDLYLLGGGEDRPQTLAARELRAVGTVARGVAAGAAVFAVCAGFQLLGEQFPGADGPEPGLDVLDVTTLVGTGSRAVGELLVEPAPELALPPITGFENHQGVTRIGADAMPLGEVVVGRGNGVDHDGRAVEGARTQRIVATYAHGPVLARNPALADHVLSLIVGPLPALDLEVVNELRRQRLAAVRGR